LFGLATNPKKRFITAEDCEIVYPKQLGLRFAHARAGMSGLADSLLKFGKATRTAQLKELN